MLDISFASPCGCYFFSPRVCRSGKIAMPRRPRITLAGVPLHVISAATTARPTCSAPKTATVTTNGLANTRRPADARYLALAKDADRRCAAYRALFRYRLDPAKRNVGRSPTYATEQSARLGRATTSSCRIARETTLWRCRRRRGNRQSWPWRRGLPAGRPGPRQWGCLRVRTRRSAPCP